MKNLILHLAITISLIALSSCTKKTESKPKLDHYVIKAYLYDVETEAFIDEEDPTDMAELTRYLDYFQLKTGSKDNNKFFFNEYEDRNKRAYEVLNETVRKVDFDAFEKKDAYNYWITLIRLLPETIDNFGNEIYGETGFVIAFHCSAHGTELGFTDPKYDAPKLDAELAKLEKSRI